MATGTSVARPSLEATAQATSNRRRGRLRYSGHCSGQASRDELRRTSGRKSAHRHRRFHHQALFALHGEGPARHHRQPRHNPLQCGINIDAVVQKPGCPKSHLPFLITLEECKASLVDQALQQINSLDFPGAALFASANSVGGNLVILSAPYRLGTI